MRYGIFGGSFDPIHWGHLLLAETCLQKANLDRVIFVPTGISPHRAKARQTPGEVRAEMIELAITGCDEFSVSRIEIEREKTSYTVETVRHFRDSLLDAELFLLVGADMYYDLPHWYEASEILKTVIPIGVYRHGTPPPHAEVFRDSISTERLELFRRHIVKMPLIEISSTMIREAAANGESVRFLLPRPVEALIRSHRLYRSEDG
ncbi:MAG: nicotinate-nucleotide adenylyltransferase [Planctomycetaceae bacterium]|nr:nicotinate-nucleotide adenylyltransferase [Planctomycetaceae bacterium]